MLSKLKNTVISLFIEILTLAYGGDEIKARWGYNYFASWLKPSRPHRLYFMPPTCWQDGKFNLIKKIVQETEDLSGRVVENGIYRGGGTFRTSELLKNLNSDRTITGIDSFEGLPEPSEEDRMETGEIYFHKNKFEETNPEVLRKKARLMDLDSYMEIHKGYFQDVLPEVFDDSDICSIVIVDCDQYKGAKYCLNFFYDLMESGGYVVIDDYDLPRSNNKHPSPGVQKAVDEFMEDVPETIQDGFDSMVYFKKK